MQLTQFKTLEKLAASMRPLFSGVPWVYSSRVTMDGFLSIGSATELTIDAGAVTVTQTHHTIDTESDAASDDLDTIGGGSTGDILVLQAANGARTVVFKDGTDNLRLAGDFSADAYADQIVLKRDSTGNWNELCRSNNG